MQRTGMIRHPKCPGATPWLRGPRLPQRGWGAYLPPRAQPPAAQATDAAADAEVFMQLLQAAGATGSVQLRSDAGPSAADCAPTAPIGAGGRGLYASAAAAPGDTLLRVPRSICLVIDYASSAGLTVPDAPWPRLRQGLNAEEPLPWDLLLGLALMDAVAGDGPRWWEAYADHILPPVDAVTLPMCWPTASLGELQHKAVAAAAAEQQDRLRRLFPGFMEPLGPALPSWLQWGFACVRSRAFRAGSEAFAFVPFLDMANHAREPNADFRVAADGAFELFALSEVAAGSEVTISYSGQEGFTNQRWMSQYGFVPAGGNMADRLDITVPEGLGTTSLRLEYIQDALGDAIFMDALRGKNPYLFAALKSLPLADEQPSSSQAPPSSSSSSSSGGSDGSSGVAGGGAEEAVGGASEGEVALALALLDQVAAAAAECSRSSLEEDEALLERLTQQPQGRLTQQPEAGVAAAEGGSDGSLGGLSPPCMLAAVRYRVERKRLLAAAQLLLQLFLRGRGDP